MARRYLLLAAALLVWLAAAGVALAPYSTTYRTPLGRTGELTCELPPALRAFKTDGYGMFSGYNGVCQDTAWPRVAAAGGLVLAGGSLCATGRRHPTRRQAAALAAAPPRPAPIVPPRPAVAR